MPLKALIVAIAVVATAAPSFAEAAEPCAGSRGTVAVNPDFACEILDADLPGAAFAVAEDVNGDSKPEIVVSSFGTLAGTNIPTGTVGYYQFEDGAWVRHTVFDETAGIKFPNRVTVTDMDGDGDADMLVPAGFFACHFGGQICGYLGWFEQDGDNWIEHVIRDRGAAVFHHAAYAADISGDGLLDIITVAETVGTASAEVFLGTGTGEFSTDPIQLGPFGGSLPVVEDVDGDGDLDLASAQFFMPGASFAWLENTSLDLNAAVRVPFARADVSVWVPAFVSHAISVTEGPSIQLSKVPGVGWIGTNHTNTTDEPVLPAEGVFRLTPGDNPRLPWASEKISGEMKSQPNGQGIQGAPGVFGWGDLNGDGLTDLGVSGDGDARAFLLTQRPDGGFDQVTVAGVDHLNRANGMGQAGGGFIADFDQDGSAEVLFTSYEQGIVALFHPVA